MKAMHVSTPFGETVTWRWGHGPAVLVLHGGPGLDHRYLVEPLRQLGVARTFICFDQIGCNATPGAPSDYTEQATIAHASAIAAHIYREFGPVGLIGHSWGTHVALRLCAASNCEYTECALISPFPTTRKGLNESFSALERSFPGDVAQQLAELDATVDSGSLVLKLILPYYLHSRSAEPLENLDYYNPLLNDSVISSLDEFSTVEIAAQSLPHRSILLRGDADFIPRHALEPLPAKVRRFVELPEIGHFPFLEAPKKFTEELSAFWLAA